VRIRTLLVLGAVFLGVTGIGSAAPRAHSDTETFVLAPGLSAAQQHSASTAFGGSKVEVTISGTVTATIGQSPPCVYDAFYQGCGTHAIRQANVDFLVHGSPNLGPFVPPFGVIPAYRDDHTYTFTSTLNQPQGLSFWAVPFGKPLSGYTYSGGFTITLAGPDTGCTKSRHTSGVGAVQNEVRVMCVDPDCQFHKGGSAPGAWLPLEKDAVLKQGDDLTCDPDGLTKLAFGDNSTVTVKNTTALKIASFFTDGGVVKTEILLRMGEVAAQVNHSEATKSDFRIVSPAQSGSVRGTIFTSYYDPGSNTAVTSVARGVVAVDPTKPGLPTVNVGAGKEVVVTSTSISPVAPIGKAGARGGVNPVTARDLVLAAVAKQNGPCGLVTPRTKAFSVKPSGAGWVVSVTFIAGKAKGVSTWSVLGRRVTPANPLARKIAAGCR
jgi:hypothetical protein